MPISYIVDGRRVDPDGKPLEGGDNATFDAANVSDADLERLKKAELLAVAKAREVEVSESQTNAEIVAAIRAAGNGA